MLVFFRGGQREEIMTSLFATYIHVSVLSNLDSVT